MEKPKSTNIFLDSQFIIENNYFAGTQINQLFKYCNKNLINIFITEIVKNEVAKNFTKTLEGVKETLNKTLVDSKILKNNFSFNELHSSAKKDGFRIINSSNTFFQKMLTRYIGDETIRVIPIPQNITEDVFSLYFNCEPPFSKKKNKEFPDAFNILTVSRWCETKSETCYFISRDPDFESFKSENIFIEKDAKNILEIIAQNINALQFQGNVKKVKEITDANQESIYDQIKYLFEVELSKVFKDYIGHCEFDVTKIDFLKSYHITLEGNKATTLNDLRIEYLLKLINDKDKSIDNALNRTTFMSVELNYDLTRPSTDTGWKVVKADKLNDYDPIIISIK